MDPTVVNWTQEARSVFNVQSIRRVALLAKVRQMKTDIYDTYRRQCVQKMHDILRGLTRHTTVVQSNEMYLAIDGQNSFVVVSHHLTGRIRWHMPLSFARMRKVADRRVTTKSLSFCAHLLNRALDIRIAHVRKQMRLVDRKRMQPWPPYDASPPGYAICSKARMRRFLNRHGILAMSDASLESCLIWITQLFRAMASEQYTGRKMLCVFDVQQFAFLHRTSVFGGRRIYHSAVTPVYCRHHMKHMSLRCKRDKALRRIRDAIQGYPYGGLLKLNPFHRMVMQLVPAKYSRSAVLLLKANMERYMYETFKIAKQIAFVNKRNILHLSDMQTAVSVQ